MSLIVRLNTRLKGVIHETCRASSTLTVRKSNEITDVPEYPPIVEVSEKARRERKFQDWKLDIENLSTVEQKLMKVNLPRYYGYDSILLSDNKIPYNALPLIQHCTRTSLRQQSELPDFYKKQSEDVTQIISSVKSQIQQSIALETSLAKFRISQKTNLTDGQKEDLLTSAIVEHINRIVLNSLTEKCEHLRKSEIDIVPRHEAFWFAGGFKPSERLKKTRENDRYQEEFANDPIDRPFQYQGTPILTLRNDVPLLPIVSLNDASSSDLNVPMFNYNPKVLGYNSELRHGTNIPGFWPSDDNKFGILMYNRRGHITDRKLNFAKFSDGDNLEALHSQGILSSFAWLHSQACYQGFSTYNEITYPLITQNIITNGQYWSFYVYQLNTTLLHRKNIESNHRRNICWATDPQPLFAKFDTTSNQLVDFNDKVLENVIKFYLNKPQKRENVNMTPYLDEKEKIIADIEDSAKREWLEKQYKHLMSNRPRHRNMYEIYNWERIYKINHKTRALEPRRRPFELKDNNPLLTRQYDHHHPRYVPKKFRPEGTKRKNQNKWEITYYP